MNTSLATSQSLDAAIATVSEFPERLGPVLIKELRQGLRSGLFVLPFVILPAVLALVAVWGLSIDNLGEARTSVSVCYWCAIIVPVLIIMPLRALGAIRSERDAQTLDLLQLTPLTAWRIVLAKWSSLMAQALLWVAALLPFFVLRYFFGGMNLVEEAIALVWTVIIGGVLTALALVVSTLPRLVFWLSLAGMILMGFWGVGWIFAIFFARLGITRIFGSSSSPSFAANVLLLLMGLHVIYLALAFAASRIAPLADNYALRLRAGTLVLFAWFGLAWLVLPTPDESIRWMFFGIAGLATTILTGIDVISARMPLLTHVRPWARFGPFGLAVGRAFQPGWPSAVVFFTAVATITTAISMLSHGEPAAACAFALITWPALLLPRAFQCLFSPRSQERPGLHLVLHILGPLFAIMLAAFKFALDSALFVPAAIFPSAMWWVTITDVLDLEANIITIAIVGLLWLLGFAGLFYFHSRAYWTAMNNHAKTARAIRRAGPASS
jgi:hypothetical protein